MYRAFQGGTGDLDQIRQSRGNSACSDYFARLYGDRRENAVGTLNDSRLKFGTLFVLTSEIEEFGLSEKLNQRNRTALLLCRKILNAKKRDVEQEESISYQNEEVRPVLMWILKTGAADDGLNEDFDRILDIAAAILIKNCREKTVLPIVAELIFRRYRKGSYVNDLVWAFFQCRDPQALRLIARRLSSSDEKEAALACRLLNLPNNGASPNERRRMAGSFDSWLNENGSYLYFTGEGFHCSARPNICNVDLGAKYLCKNISPRNRTPEAPLTEAERNCLNCFKAAEENSKKILAGYSNRIHAQNPKYWRQWIHYPLEKQVEIARSGREGKP